MRLRTWAIITSEILMFVVLLIISWVDEFLDFPYLFLGAIPAPHRMEEFMVETVSISIVALLVILVTLLLLRRLDQVERFLRVCAWCKKIHSNDRWVDFEEYEYSEHMLKTTHGICPDCVNKVKTDIKDVPDETES